LHLGVGPLHSIQFYGITEFPGSYRRNSTATHADPVIISAQEHDLISFAGFFLLGIFQAGITHTASLHDHLVVPVLPVFFPVFKTQKRSANERLSELVPVIAGPVGGFCQDIFRGVVHPGAGPGSFRPFFEPGQGSHVYGRAG